MAMTMERRETRQAGQRETHDAAVIRLAGEAAARGVTVYRAGSEWFAPSRTRPGTLHRVTAYSCDCPGFARHQRCGHHSALLAHMGWLPAGDPDPAPPVAPVALAVPSAPCPDCDGAGHRRMSTGGGLDAWVYAACRCQRAAA
jgi:hypothetical protein